MKAADDNALSFCSPLREQMAYQTPKIIRSGHSRCFLRVITAIYFCVYFFVLDCKATRWLCTSMDYHHHHHNSHPVFSPLQDEGLSQGSPV